MAIHIGTSGWSYDHWQGILYPHNTPVSQRLDYYIQRYQTVEVNSTFYRWPPNVTFVRWYRRLPEHFLFTVKAPRGLTHGKQLYSPENWLYRIRSSMRYLGRKRGILLVQLSPQFEYDYQRLAYFLRQLPRWLRVALEFRHPSWHHEETWKLLEKEHAAYCVMSGANLPCCLRATADFVYIRLHGPDHNHLYAGSYSDNDLRWWADRIREWESMNREVFLYFNNDGHGNAVHNASRLIEILG
jgi:uncharacterized protein YecE (DUF72 family)